MNFTLKNFIRLIIIVIVIAIYLLYFPRKAPIGNPGFIRNNVKLVIIPMYGIPPKFIDSLKIDLEKSHNFEILVTTEIGKGDEFVIPGQAQYNSDLLAQRGAEISKTLNNNHEFTILITNQDINYPSSGLRYLYSVHYKGISVVSLARINPLNYGVDFNIIEIPEKFSKMKERALKIINKSIGYGIYKYDASSNINSVMYGPIMGPSDLDKVGSWY